VARTSDHDRPVPAATVSRLPLYLRVLEALADGGSATVSSDLLGELSGTSAAIVRKDLSCLGSLGTRGAGYDIAALHSRLAKILGADRAWPVAIVGMGNLGHALANYPGLRGPTFPLAALFDVDPAKVGRAVAGVAVSHLDELERVASKEKVAVGIVTTPAAAAEEVANRLVAAGIRSILNFAPVRLTPRPGVVVRDVDVGMELFVLSFNETMRGS
jgi:redox-sensing transcriptional repressor